MRAARSLWIPVILLAVLTTLTGCQGPQANLQTSDYPSPGMNQATTTTPSAAPTGDVNRGFLLRTGAIQLGPGVGRNAWGWQGDGMAGF